MSPVCRIVTSSRNFLLGVGLEQVINGIPLVGKCCLISDTERLVRFPTETSIFRPDGLLRPLNHPHEFPEHQSRI